MLISISNSKQPTPDKCHLFKVDVMKKDEEYSTLDLIGF